MADQVAAIGEPWLRYFDPIAMTADLRMSGFQEIGDLNLGDISTRYFAASGGVRSRVGPHLVRARRT